MADHAIKIESGVPLPRREWGDGVPLAELKPSAKWAPLLARLNVGDSFLYGPENNHAGSVIWRAAHRLGIKVTTRKTKGGWRCWRIA